jgi:uncharacterized membrane protein YdjX (TVP38/TMEM64 family)
MEKKRIQKITVVVLVCIAVALFWMFDLGQYLTLSYLKASQAKLSALYEGNRVLVIGIYMLIYILVTALSLPGAAVMTLAGGGLFGLWVGVLVVSFASTIGATLACFVSRFLLRDWVQTKFAEKLGTVNTGFEKEGDFYLFTLRLVPIFPFFVINLVMGLTKMPLLSYYWISQVGMLPGTVVYVNAGKELAKIDSLSGIVSPGLIVSFVILGIFPLAVKKLLGWYQKNSK